MKMWGKWINPLKNRYWNHHRPRINPWPMGYGIETMFFYNASPIESWFQCRDPWFQPLDNFIGDLILEPFYRFNNILRLRSYNYHFVLSIYA